MLLRDRKRTFYQELVEMSQRVNAIEIDEGLCHACFLYTTDAADE
ncbi:hypothetical protein [Criibacterium bergeronii]|nr:hypothetical protein [Criibacterium bergeronii]